MLGSTLDQSKGFVGVLAPRLRMLRIRELWLLSGRAQSRAKPFALQPSSRFLRKFLPTPHPKKLLLDQTDILLLVTADFVFAAAALVVVDDIASQPDDRDKQCKGRDEPLPLVVARRRNIRSFMPFILKMILLTFLILLILLILLLLLALLPLLSLWLLAPGALSLSRSTYIKQKQNWCVMLLFHFQKEQRPKS